MGRTILRQGNGLYCVFSSIVDDIIIKNATSKEIFDQYIEDEKKLLKIKFERWIEEADKMSLDEKIKTINMIKYNKKSDDLGEKLFEEAIKLLK